MRSWIAPAVICLAWAGCDRPTAVKKPIAAKLQTVNVSLLPDTKSWSSGGPASTKDYHWPYSTMSTGGRGAPGEWKSGLAYDRDRVDPKDVELRFFDVAGGAIRVEVTFSGPPSPDLASITFDRLRKVDRVAEVAKDGGPDRPYGSWVQQGLVFELRAPEAPATVSFIAKPAAR
jgi:hypothetical protein